MVHRFAATLVACGLATTLLLGLALPYGSSAALADAATAAATAPQNSITVAGSGVINVAPDMATVTFGALAIRSDAQSALVVVNQTIAAAVKNLHALHINDRRIQTQNISLQPRYDNNNNLTGYQASETLSVIADSLAEVGPVVDAGVSAGANQNVSVTYGLKDENGPRLSALKLAVSLAKSRAEAVASVLGRSLKGAHVQLSESGQVVPPPVVEVGAMAAPRAADGSATQSFGGTLTVREDVTLTYTF
jgi:uncharacterized protein YggE